MDRCVKCDAYIDTDFDPACYVERLNTKIKGRVDWDCICEPCREDMADADTCSDEPLHHG